MSSNKFSISVTIDAIDKASGTMKATLDKIEREKDAHDKKDGNRWKALTEVSDKVGEGIAKIGEMGLEIAKVTAEAALVTFELVNLWTEAVGKIKEMAFVTGLSREEYQQWSYATKQLGVDTGEFNSGVEKLTKGLGEARNHAGKFYEAFKGSPLLTQAMHAKNNGEALELMYRALDKAKDANERNAMATAMFGKGGIAMVKALHDGLPTLLAMRDEVGGLGSVTEEGFEVAEKFERSWNRVKQAGMGVANSIGTELAPVLANYLTQTKDWLVTNRELIATKVSEFIKGFWEGLEKIGRWMVSHKEDIRDAFVTGLETAVGAARFLVDHLDGVTTAVKVLGAAWVATRLVSGVESVSKFATLAAEMFGASAAKAGVIGGSIGALTVAVGTWTAAYYLWKDALDQVEEFKTWLKDTDTLNQRTDKVNKDRADTHNAGVRALTEQTTDKSSPLAEILRGSFGQTTSAGELTINVKLIDPHSSESVAEVSGFKVVPSTNRTADVGVRMMAPNIVGRR